jgi:transcriptional regulator with XRE-family HTH domain
MLTLYRASRRWTTRDLAAAIGTSPATLSRIERGQTMDASTLLKLLDWLLRPSDVALDGPAPSLLDPPPREDAAS